MTDTKINIKDIAGFDILYESMMKCARGVRWKSTTGHYLHEWITELAKLEEELKNETYKERHPKFFNITEPKPRTIMSIHFRDRIFLRSLNDNAIYPQIIKSFILDNYACQKGKGTDKARERLRDFMRSFYRKYKTNGYVLQIDVKGYYPNMNRNFVKTFLKEYLDDETLKQTQKVIDFHPGEIGFCPGDQTIQNIGITALDPLDHFIKERLRVKYYIRYMDDLILLHQNKEFLENCLNEIEQKFITYNMQIHPAEVKPIKEKILFLGFVYKLTETGKVLIFVNPQKIKHEKKKIKRMVALVKKNKLTKRDVDIHFKAYKASIRFGNSHQMIYRLNRWYEELWRNYECTVNN